MKIGIVIWKLLATHGGLEKVGIDLAHEMLRRGHDITIVYRNTVKQLTIPQFIADEIKLISLEITSCRGIDMATKREMNTARNLIVQSGLDVLVLLSSWDVLLLFPAIMKGTGIPFLLSEHNDPEAINSVRWNSYERHACLAMADRIHVLLSSFIPSFPAFLRKRIIAIPNAVPTPAAFSLQEADSTEKHDTERKILLAAGRFNDAHKNFSLLIRAFAQLASAFPDWDLVLCGEGEDRPLYKKLMKDLGLENRFFMPGNVFDMGKYYVRSDLFCTPSQYEGFSLVTAEAQSYGVPCIAFQDCNGPNMIISHEESGFLIDTVTVDALAQGMAKLMPDEMLRKRMGVRGRELNERFAPDLVYDQWERLLHDTATCRGNTHLQQMENFDYEKRIAENALQEILSRPTPFARPYQKELNQLSLRCLQLEKAQKAARRLTGSDVLRWIARRFDA
jgi:glycosyltransferase involved in cell wall biosynthesis